MHEDDLALAQVIQALADRLGRLVGGAAVDGDRAQPVPEYPAEEAFAPVLYIDLCPGEHPAAAQDLADRQPLGEDVHTGLVIGHQDERAFVWDVLLTDVLEVVLLLFCQREPDRLDDYEPYPHSLPSSQCSRGTRYRTSRMSN